MKLLIVSILSITLFLSSCKTEPTVPVKLSKLYSNHMVIQRDKDIHVFGFATPGININAELAGNRASGKVKESGKFNITLPQLEAGGPYELTISTADTMIFIKDILIGDVWICGGQSNMEFELSNSKNGSKAIDSAIYNKIRIINIPNDIELTAQDSFRNNIQWSRCDIDPIIDFSAVGYYFGVELYEKLGIPIGLIGANWGGSNSETWTQTQALDSFPEYNEKSTFVNTADFLIKDIQNKGRVIFDKWVDSIYYTGTGMDDEWFDPTYDASDWKEIKVPGHWEDQIAEMDSFDGVVWYRREFDIPKDFIGQDMKFWLSTINDYDITWLNGKKIGETLSPFTWRGYSAPSDIIKEKNNVMIVRVYNRANNGGFNGISAYYDFYPTSSKKHKGSLAGTWTYKVGSAVKDTFNFPVSVNSISKNDYPSIAYNAMINPMVQFPIKGAIWYQGEANASRAYRYRELFPAMINNWRQQWNIGDFPFYFVQLANYGTENEKLGDSYWAELREAQDMTLSLSNTGMATAIDIGNPDDIHPLNKLDVGKRLAYNAMHKTYDIKTLYSGPTFKNFTVKDSKVTIEYDFTGSGLVTINNKAPQEFIIAGSDSIFYKAKAVIVGNTIAVSSTKVDKPISVRYAWKNSPEVNLFNKEGLPAMPFRTDDWKGVTYEIRCL